MAASRTSFIDAFFRASGHAVDKWEHYLAIYEAELDNLVATQRPLRLLEIGVQNGGSLEVWQSYLPDRSEIRGIDIDPKVKNLEFGSELIRVDVCDASDSAGMGKLLNGAVFDVIIDDGSHLCADVRKTFEILFNDHLCDGGRYIIEDLHCSYRSDYGGGLQKKDASIEFLKTLIDCLHADYFELRDEVVAELKDLDKLRRVLARIAFYDSVVVIEKLQLPKTQPYRRVLGGQTRSVHPISSWFRYEPTAALQTLVFGTDAAKQFDKCYFEELEQRRCEVAGLIKTVNDLSAENDALRARLETMRAHPTQR